MEGNTLSMTQTDEMIMKLLHYFVTVENYSPIVLKGAKNEIWLEKFDGEYKIVRLVSNYIHNNEQLNMDIYRTKQIMKRIRRLKFKSSTVQFINEITLVEVYWYNRNDY